MNIYLIMPKCGEKNYENTAITILFGQNVDSFPDAFWETKS